MELLSYKDSNLDSRIIRAVEEMGFEQMTPIQAQSIPVLLEGKDVIGQAQTGTGKTAAFGIPVIQNTDSEDSSTQALILCPTRELAIQAAREIRGFAKFMHGIKVLPIYGGQDISKQIRSLKGGVQIVVGTPGRIMDHIRRHTLKLKNLKMLVLDEADEMLDMGFRDDIETILDSIESNHQTALFSATMPKEIMDITTKYQKDAVLVKVVKKELTIPLVRQYYYEVRSRDKEEVICRLLDYYNPKRSLIFCNTKKMVDELADNLKGRGYFAEGLHGDLNQFQRDKVMAGFRKGNTDILIATDVAARGIDVDGVEAVFNYDVPQDIEYYVHRIGRTGRAGRKGRAFTLVVGKEIFKLREIERTCKTKIKNRLIPTVSDITQSKSTAIMQQVLETLRNEDIKKCESIIEKMLNEEDCTAIEIAAAFLKRELGEQPENIILKEEPYVPEKKDKDKKNGRRQGRGDRFFKERRKGDGKKRFKDGKFNDGKFKKDNKENKNRKDNKNKKIRDNKEEPFAIFKKNGKKKNKK